MSRLSFARLNRHYVGYGDFLDVLQVFIKLWCDFEIFRLLTTLDEQSSTALVANVRVYMVDWDALSGND